MSKEILHSFLKGSAKFRMTENKFWLNLVKHNTLSRTEFYNQLDLALAGVFKNNYTIALEKRIHFRCTIEFSNNTDAETFKLMFSDEIKWLG
jgi:hypothetical protein